MLFGRVLLLALIVAIYKASTISARVLPKSKDVLSELVEGDMIFGEVIQTSRRRRSVLIHPQFYWPGGVVPYQFDSIYPLTDEFHKLTNEAFKHIMDRTCITFIKRTNQSNYLNVTSQYKTSCHSFVGRKKVGHQELNLGTNCHSLSVIIHEILHALGFLHEQSRPDRDSYVYINYTNIDPRITDSNKQFEIYHKGASGDASTQNLPYDFASVMHYNRFTFSKFFPDGKIPYEATKTKDSMTIYAKKDWTIYLGNQKGMSDLDIVRVNKFYKCPPKTSTTTTTTTTTTVPTTTTPVTTTTTPETTTTTPETTTTTNMTTTTISTTITLATTTTLKTVETETQTTTTFPKTFSTNTDDNTFLKRNSASVPSTKPKITDTSTTFRPTKPIHKTSIFFKETNMVDDSGSPAHSAYLSPNFSLTFMVTLVISFLLFSVAF